MSTLHKFKAYFGMVPLEDYEDEYLDDPASGRRDREREYGDAPYGGYAPSHRDDYAPSQSFAKPRRDRGEWGLIYRSVRHPGGECIAAFRPQAVTIPHPGAALAYVWDGERIAKVYEKSEVLFDLTQ